MYLIGAIWDDAFFLLMGLCWGSFANVAAFRYSKNMSTIFPPSFCPNCRTPVAIYDNIPLLSWLWLRARARCCGVPISFRYPLVEVLTGVLFLMAFQHLGWSWTLLEVLILFQGLVITSLIDFDSYLLPDIYTISGIVVGVLGAWLNPERSFWDGILGVALGGGFLWAIAALYFAWKKEEGMGGGDIKLLAWIGAVLGWQSIWFTLIAASVVGAIAGLWLARQNRRGLKTVIPFGPYLAFGAVLYALGIGDWLSKIYFSWLFPAGPLP